MTRTVALALTLALLGCPGGGSDRDSASNDSHTDLPVTVDSTPNRDGHEPPDDAPGSDQFQSDVTAMPNDTCLHAKLVTLSGGKATVAGDTSILADEFPDLNCNATNASTALDGPQAYYRFSATAGRWYKMVVEPTFKAYVYLFTSSACTETAIETDCQSKGASGINSRYIPANTKQAIYFKPSTTGEVRVAVDSNTATDNGSFTLTIEEFTYLSNGTCPSGLLLSFSGGKATVQGDTGMNLTPDEYPTLTCGGTGGLKGPQAYFKFFGLTGKTYTIKLTADSSQFLYLYLFGDTCVQSAISGDCSSAGAQGDFLDQSVSHGNTGTLTFSSSSTDIYTIAVDSHYEFNAGGFTLEVTESP